MRQENKVIKYFTQKELKKLFSVIEKSKEDWNRFWLRDLTIFNIAYYWWLRASEIWMLKLENYNKSTGEIFVKRLKWSLNNTIRLDSTRINLLNKYIREYKITNEEAFLFISRNKVPVSGKTIEFLMSKYWEMTNISREKLHPHTLKHSIAVHLAESWADIKEIQQYLGHRRIESTLQYFAYTTVQQNHFYEKIAKNSKLV